MALNPAQAQAKAIDFVSAAISSGVIKLEGNNQADIPTAIQRGKADAAYIASLINALTKDLQEND